MPNRAAVNFFCPSPFCRTLGLGGKPCFSVTMMTMGQWGWYWITLLVANCQTFSPTRQNGGWIKRFTWAVLCTKTACFSFTGWEIGSEIPCPLCPDFGWVGIWKMFSRPCRRLAIQRCPFDFSWGILDGRQVNSLLKFANAVGTFTMCPWRRKYTWSWMLHRVFCGRSFFLKKDRLSLESQICPSTRV